MKQIVPKVRRKVDLDFGRQVRARREALGWSRLIFAARADVSFNTIQQLELHGLVPLRVTLKRICDALGIVLEPALPPPPPLRVPPLKLPEPT